MYGNWYQQNLMVYFNIESHGVESGNQHQKLHEGTIYLLKSSVPFNLGTNGFT